MVMTQKTSRVIDIAVRTFDFLFDSTYQIIINSDKIRRLLQF